MELSDVPNVKVTVQIIVKYLRPYTRQELTLIYTFLRKNPNIFCREIDTYSLPQAQDHAVL